jgi:hypothetical protein
MEYSINVLRGKKYRIIDTIKWYKDNLKADSQYYKEYLKILNSTQDKLKDLNETIKILEKYQH